jgi:formate/nitrite transporter FocA (FNT family)
LKNSLYFSLYHSQIGNALVCLAVWSNHSMRTVTNIYIVNLAVADFFVILFCLPPTVVSKRFRRTKTAKKSQNYNWCRSFIENFILFAQIWDVTESWLFSEMLCKIVVYFQVSYYRLDVESKKSLIIWFICAMLMCCLRYRKNHSQLAAISPKEKRRKIIFLTHLHLVWLFN